MTQDHAQTGDLSRLMLKLGEHLDDFLKFEHSDAADNQLTWQHVLGGDLPEQGIGAESVIETIGQYLLPNGSSIPNPGCTSFITTGATSIGALANLAGAVASPQRFGLTAFNYLEEKSLDWMAELFGLPTHMKGIYSSGGSTANIVALGAARQWAFEKIGIDPSLDGVNRKTRIYATKASHKTIHRAAAVLGLGRSAVCEIATDNMGRMCINALYKKLYMDANLDILPIAIVTNAGATSTGTIDKLDAIADLAKEFDIWLHVDGAYGLPGILDPQVTHLYKGLEHADSVIVDPHKWLGAPIGIGATYVRDRSLLHRAFTQEVSDYLEGACENVETQHSMDGLGIPYHDFGLELSAPCRGAVVWALLKEIGKAGIQARICRHNEMARHVAKRVEQHTNLELLQIPTLSICCFRYIAPDSVDLNELNKRIHRQLIRNGNNMPSTAVLHGKLAIRPCFIGARTTLEHADALVDEVLKIGAELYETTLQLASTKQDTYNPLMKY
jgi:glutamate/tyrosine decarboxylase-like PLP-dependent enzyme